MAVLKGFKKFLKEYRVIGISIGFVVAIAASNFIQSLINDILLPVLRPLISKSSVVWEDMVLSIGSVNLRIGLFLSTFLNLLVIY
ncbi:MAG: MscL family protein [archaeon]|nr:MscL family protein [archaeon]